jgi:hypothetical protein
MVVYLAALALLAFTVYWKGDVKGGGKFKDNQFFFEVNEKGK